MEPGGLVPQWLISSQMYPLRKKIIGPHDFLDYRVSFVIVSYCVIV
jgi:hypothetical protein